MTSILSLISGSFGRALLLGTFFPVTIAALLALLFVVPFFPADVPLLAPLAQLEPGWKTALFTLAVILGAGLLYNLNTPLIRLYEGYAWEHSRIGKWAADRERRRCVWATSRRTHLRAFLETLRAADAEDAAIEKIEPWRTRVAQRAANEYPGADLVLPTRLGNVLRSSEEYPRTVYGISTVSVWPRLVAVLSKDTLALLDESKASLDFMINASFLSGALSASILVAGLVVPSRIDWPEWLIHIAVTALASRLFYTGAVGAAAAWGNQVKSAFDLFRWDLLKKLGYESAPADAAEEQLLWGQISRRMIYGNPPAGKPLLPYKPEPPLIISTNGEP